MIKDETIAEPETFEIVIPDELPVGSVVVDRFGRAWQRLAVSMFGAQWCVTGKLVSLVPGLLDAPQLQWALLLVQRGPVTVIYNPERTRNDQE